MGAWLQTIVTVLMFAQATPGRSVSRTWGTSPALNERQPPNEPNEDSSDFTDSGSDGNTNSQTGGELEFHWYDLLRPAGHPPLFPDHFRLVPPQTSLVPSMRQFFGSQMASAYQALWFSGTDHQVIEINRRALGFGHRDGQDLTLRFQLDLLEEPEPPLGFRYNGLFDGDLLPISLAVATFVDWQAHETIGEFVLQRADNLNTYILTWALGTWDVGYGPNADDQRDLPGSGGGGDDGGAGAGGAIAVGANAAPKPLPKLRTADDGQKRTYPSLPDLGDPSKTCQQPMKCGVFKAMLNSNS